MAAIGRDDFVEFVTPHLMQVSNLAARLVGPADRDELVRDALTLARRRWASFGPERAGPRSWLLAVCVDASHRRTRRFAGGSRPMARRWRTRQEVVDVDPSSTDGPPDVEEALAVLSGRERLVVDLHYFVGLDVGESAAVLGIFNLLASSVLADARVRLGLELDRSDEIDGLLQRRGARWRASQPPATVLDPAALDERERRPWFRRPAALVGVAVVVLVSIGAVVASHGSGPTQAPADSAAGGGSSISLAGGGSTTPQPSAADRAALAEWAGFPADGSPRPLVLLDDPVLGPATGFPTTAARDALSAGSIGDPPSFPASPSMADGYPLVDAAHAVDIMRSAGEPVGHPAPLPITSLRLSAALFATDRGRVSLPAWLVTFDGVPDPVRVLAVAPTARFSSPTSATRLPTTVMAQVGRPGDATIVLTIPGSPSRRGPCGATYRADVAESSVAVAVDVTEMSRPASRTHGDVVCTGIAVDRRLAVKLAAPLGDRVLVDARTASAVSVDPPDR